MRDFGGGLDVLAACGREECTSREHVADVVDRHVADRRWALAALMIVTSEGNCNDATAMQQRCGMISGSSDPTGGGEEWR